MADLAVHDVPDLASPKKPAKRAKKSASDDYVMVPPALSFTERLHGTVTKLPTYMGDAKALENSEFVLVSDLQRPRAQSTKWVAQSTVTGGRTFNFAGPVLFPRMTTEQLIEESQYRNDTTIDLSFAMPIGPGAADATIEGMWKGYDDAAAACAKNFETALHKGARAVAQLVRDKKVEKIPGLDDTKRKRWAKIEEDQLVDTLISNWGACPADKGHVSIKKRVYQHGSGRLQELVTKADRSATEEAELKAILKSVRDAVTVVGPENSPVTLQTPNLNAAPVELRTRSHMVCTFFEIVCQVVASNMHISCLLDTVILVDELQGSGSGAGAGSASAVLKALAQQ